MYDGEITDKVCIGGIANNNACTFRGKCGAGLLFFPPPQPDFPPLGTLRNEVETFQKTRGSEAVVCTYSRGLV
jgi:hypothetical protein